MPYTQTEIEAIGLCIALEAVGDMANHALLDIRDISQHYPGEAEVYFHTSVHQELFIIRLLDFVKETGDSRLTGVQGSCLKVLQSACATGSFDGNSIDAFRKAVDEFASWLSHRAHISLWLPTLDIEASIEVSRLDFISISGNYFKHNLSRLTGVSKDVQRILEGNGYPVPLEQIPLALEDFQEHLQENYFVYYGTWLAELLNNVRWGLQEYLQPIFAASYTKDGGDDFRYRYEYPAEIQQEIPKRWFWRLMNNIRSGPSITRFAGAHYLKTQSSIERQR